MKNRRSYQACKKVAYEDKEEEAVLAPKTTLRGPERPHQPAIPTCDNQEIKPHVKPIKVNIFAT
jgi:hypothetical protein